MMTPEVKDHIAFLMNFGTKPVEFKPVSGGSVSETWRVISGDYTAFCKISSNDPYPDILAKEASGIEAITETRCIKCPFVRTISAFLEYEVLLIQWIEPGKPNTESWKQFGEQLAKMHVWKDAKEPMTQFGFHYDNYMGSLPQSNTPTDDWCTFFREQRLKPQLKLASEQGLISSSHLREFENLYQKLPAIFPDTKPSLVHGDLWSGNFLIDQHHQPVLIDPAVYYGIPSVDLAMTTLFGGFDNEFYEAYHYWSPLPANYKDQWTVCNLYPLLIHLNLFGSGYLSSIESGLRRFR